MARNRWDDLQSSLEITFSNPALLKQAFTHASYRNEHRRPALQDNERLEFLGDAVLELVVSDYLYRTRPDLPEGELTRLRASIVCESSLVRFAHSLGFEPYIRLGKGEERSGGRHRPALLADVFEAFIGALYLDQGLPAVQAFAQRHLFPHVHDYSSALDCKTALQEWVQQHLGRDLRYETVEERGPAHAREFVVQVWVGEECMGRGSGRSKKEAEQRAAGEALQRLGRLPVRRDSVVPEAD
ncbi:ribonuclease III [Alicyclobacillus sp.]|uniref:ribonuclease III n=1 Tax=Alicyclobacillus sp. TaxID=61169 RepID=UPI0025BA7A30|nr:ribonuclease III [Alicyclobacillus sp.]MCL6516449.1 ribonuclease III [Alicyclobacillus sp.]